MIFFITLKRSKTRQDKFESIFRNNRICCFFTICKSRSGFGRICCTVFETVCASSLVTCAYQIGEHLHLTWADHLDLYSQQANPNFRFPSEQIPLFSEWIMSFVWNILNRKENDHERGFFLFLIYQEQAIGLSFKKQWCIWRSHLLSIGLEFWVRNSSCILNLNS